ncbi:MAG: DNA-binding protein [Ignavibacteriales bacterium]|nr:DNA-binding protein [Ignavibacteriales bacterium]
MGLFQKPDEQESFKFSVNDKVVLCTNCGGDHFYLLPNILLNTPGATFLGFDWANKTASTLICDNCSRMEWYLETPTQLD